MSKLRKRRESAREARTHKPLFRRTGAPTHKPGDDGHAVDDAPPTFMHRLRAALVRKALRRVEPVTELVGRVGDELRFLRDRGEAKARAILRRPAAD